MSDRNRLPAGAAVLASVVGALAGPAALAQQGAGVLEEIVVTAQKRAEDLQTVPIAVTALSGGDLAANGIVNLQQIRGFVPNFTLDEALGSVTTPKMFMRGLGVDNQVFSFETPIGLYVDGVYMARVTGAMIDVFDVERIEVLRGPQGTLYGRNSSVGAIRILTQPAPLDETEFKADLTIGSKNQRNARLVFGAPLVDGKFGARFAFNTRNNDGWQREVTTGRRAQAEDINAFRAALRYVPNENLELTLRGDYMRDHSATRSGSNFRINPDNDLYTFEESPASTPINEVEPWGLSATLDWSGGAFNLTSITAYRELKYRNAGDVDGRADVRSFEVDRQDLDQWQLTQEIFLTDKGDGPLKWVAGAFFLREHNEFHWALRIFAPPPTQHFDQDTDSYAPYAQVTWPVNDRLSLTGGLRYTYEKKEIDVTQNLADGTPNPAFNFTGTKKAEKTNYRLAVDFKATDATMMYASAGTGFRSGGFNGSARDVASVLGGSFGPEDATMYEAGIKSDLLDRRLRLNLGYFYSDYENLQQAVVRSDGTISTSNVNATVHGLELEMQAALSERWQLSGTLGTMHDDIEDSLLELKQTPALQARLGTTYRVPLAKGALRLGGDVSYSSKHHNNSENYAATLVDSHYLVNANVAWESADGHWTTMLAGYNLTDEFYPIHGFDIAGGFISSVLFTNTPRRWAFTVEYRM